MHNLGHFIWDLLVYVGGIEQTQSTNNMKKLFFILATVFSIITIIGMIWAWLSYVFIGNIPYGLFVTQERFAAFMVGTGGLAFLFGVFSSNNVDFK